MRVIGCSGNRRLVVRANTQKATAVVLSKSQHALVEAKCHGTSEDIK